MVRFVTAVTQSKTDVFCFLNNMRSSLVIQNMIHMLIGQHRFLHIDTSKFRLCGVKQIFDEIFFHVHILIVQFRKIFLIDISSGTHQRKFNKSCHWRRNDESSHAFIAGIHQQRFLTQMIQNLFRLCL